MKGTLLCAVLCLLLVGCGSTVSGVSEISTPTPTIRAYPTTHAALAPTTVPKPTLVPTSKPTMAPTQVPTTIPSRPHLGDSINVWDAAYVDSVQDMSTSHQKMHGYFFTISGIDISAVAVFDPSQNNKVIAVSMKPVSGAFDGTNMVQLAIPVDFMPTDAMSGNQVDGQTGLEWSFHSASLATEFPASYFLTNEGNMGKTGDCNIFYAYVAGAKNNIDHATLAIGDVYGV